jgi:structural maintenance of chromosome 2
MYLQEVIIDGFKSYAQKTVISGFDPQFNAITGLNGTGKSNILDAICFVLGIQNLTQVRVGNLQELVYKMGQAGVTKATVTLVFNNADVTTSPVGYESSKQITVTRQVVIGGKNKYMINGHTVQQSQVQNMFHSVQLNVNNPHFLIMQGRITKVLNMKPPEILSMIEEAAGTRMFETKKQASLKTIEKKQLKVDEITKCIDEEITPTLENLRHERQDYHAWQAANAEYEKVERFCIACDYKSAESKVLSSEQDKENLTNEYDSYLAQQTEKNQQAEICGDQIAEITKRRDEEMGGEMADLKKVEVDQSKELVKLNTLHSNQQEQILAEQDSIKQMSAQLATIEKSTIDKARDIENCNRLVIEKEGQLAEAEKEYVSKREKYHNACAGVADENTAELLSVPEQIVAWEKCERETTSKIQQCQQRVQHVKSTLAELKKANKTQSQSHTVILRQVEEGRNEIAELQSQLARLNTSGIDEKAMRKQIQQLTAEIDRVRDLFDSLNAGLQARLAFEYKDPEPRFNRSRVLGLVANLFSMKETNASTALEVVAGGKLTQVVVDNEQTGKLLLQNGQLKKRVTILPLNKLSSRVIAEDKLARARQIAQSMHGTAHLALDLVHFEPSVRKAMEYVFGGAIVCSSSDIAKAIAFDKSVRVLTVTMEGDTFDPAGTVTGGAVSQLGTLLQKIEQVRVAQQTMAEKTQQLESIQAQLQVSSRQLEQQRTVQSQIDLKTHALKILEDKLGESDYAQIAQQIQESEAELVQHDAEMTQSQELLRKAKDELKKLATAEKSKAKQREQKLKEFEAEVKAAQKMSSTIKTEVMQLKARRDALDAERSSLIKEKDTLQEQLLIAENALKRLRAEAKTLVEKLSALRDSYEEAKLAVQHKQEDVNRCSKEIQALQQKRDTFLKEAQNASLDARKITHRLKQWDKDFKEASKVIANLVKQHPWIEREKSFFGQPGTDYDFQTNDTASAYRRLKELKSEQEKLSKKINKKVMGMIENAETEYEDLNRKRQVILNDKAKIESVIEELDVKKAQALKKTWQQVNRDFGSIFSMLLPGTQAKLDPPEGMEVTEGLEVKVAFNNTWKESLTELSGGQRSLLALSLILALLLFKPAPMYILDEVDAALDLSHTQNIGMMIRSHFSSSQFIVVSLKEGMFNNANVIFRTRFVDGISAVQRTVTNARAAAGKHAGLLTASAAGGEENAKDNAAGADEDEDESAPVKKRGRAGAAGNRSVKA